MNLDETTHNRRVAFFARLFGVPLLVVHCSADSSDKNAPESPAPAPLQWELCREDFDCATVSVPVDYRDPTGPTLPLALLRAPARQAHGTRLGSLVINPGGPGAPMVARLAQTYLTLSVAFPEIADRFDVIAFDWRGVGESAPLSCIDGSLMDTVRSSDLTLQGASSVAKVEELIQQLVDGCKTKADQSLLANMDTDSAARDLEKIRQALGEPTLNFFGFSYGTLLGARYATLYPDRVGAFVLDSAVAPVMPLKERLLRRATAQKEALDRFFQACAADSKCELGAGSDSTSIASRFDTLLAKVKETGIPAGERLLSVTDWNLAISDGLRSAKWRELGADLARAEGGDGRALLSRADAVSGRKSDGSYDTSFVGLLAVSCQDQPFPPGEDLATFREAVMGASPRGTAAFVPYALCAGWPWTHPQETPWVSAPSAPPVLVISTRHDPIAPYDGGAALLAALGNDSHLLTYEGDGHIAAFHSACVREQLTKFLVSPLTHQSLTSCPPE